MSVYWRTKVMERVLKQLHPDASITLYINRDNEGAGDFYYVENHGSKIGNRRGSADLAKIEARDWLTNEKRHVCWVGCSDWEPASN